MSEIIKKDGDSYLLDNNVGDKVFRIPVTWRVFDTVKVRANSLEEAVDLMLNNLSDIPLGTAPDYAEDSYAIATSNIDDAATIAEELRENYDDDCLAEDYNYDDYE